jgi:hypothetical protein
LRSPWSHPRSDLDPLSGRCRSARDPSVSSRPPRCPLGTNQASRSCRSRLLRARRAPDSQAPERCSDPHGWMRRGPIAVVLGPRSRRGSGAARSFGLRSLPPFLLELEGADRRCEAEVDADNGQWRTSTRRAGVASSRAGTFGLYDPRLGRAPSAYNLNRKQGRARRRPVIVRQVTSGPTSSRDSSFALGMRVPSLRPSRFSLIVHCERLGTGHRDARIHAGAGVSSAPASIPLGVGSRGLAR